MAATYIAVTENGWLNMISLPNGGCAFVFIEEKAAKWLRLI